MKETDSTIKEYDNYCYREKLAGRIPKSKTKYDQERSEGKFRSDGRYAGREWNSQLGYPRLLKPFIKQTGGLDYPKLDEYRIKLAKSLLEGNKLPRWKRFRIRNNLKLINKYLVRYKVA